MPREASPRWVGAPGPAEEERGRLVRSDDGEPIVETGRKRWHPFRRTAKPAARTKCKEGGVLLYPHGCRMDGIAKMAARVRGEMG
jgi:hypothetical protein